MTNVSLGCLIAREGSAISVNQAAAASQWRLLTVPEWDTAAEFLSTHLPRCVLSEHLTDGSHVLGAFDRNESLVACVHWSPCAVLWFGAPVQIGRAGPAATAPDHRRRGVMRILLRGILEHMRANGIAIAAQETPIIGYHRQTGWEIATFARRHVADRAAVLSLETRGYRCRRADPADAPAIGVVWDKYMRARPFSASRGINYWRRSLTAGRWWIAADESGRVVGYGRGDSTDGLTELVAADVRVTRALLRAFALTASTEEVEWWTAPDCDSHFVFADPRTVSVTDHVDKLIRVVDAAAVLDRLSSAGLCGSQDVAVCDNICEWNNRKFLLQPTTADVGGLSVSPRLDVRALAALAAGAISPSSLAVAGLLGPADAQFAFGNSTSASWYPDPL
jgi:predicted acetyltransferase